MYSSFDCPILSCLNLLTPMNFPVCLVSPRPHLLPSLILTCVCVWVCVHAWAPVLVLRPVGACLYFLSGQGVPPPSMGGAVPYGALHHVCLVPHLFQCIFTFSSYIHSFCSFLLVLTLLIFYAFAFFLVFFILWKNFSRCFYLLSFLLTSFANFLSH